MLPGGGGGGLNCRTSNGLDYSIFVKYLDQNLTFMNTCM